MRAASVLIEEEEEEQYGWCTNGNIELERIYRVTFLTTSNYNNGMFGHINSCRPINATTTTNKAIKSVLCLKKTNKKQLMRREV